MKSNNIIIQLKDYNSIPYELLLLADPSKEAINDYINRGICFIAKEEDIIVGIYVLIKTRPFTMELVNVAVLESKQGMGIGKQLVLDSIGRAKIYGAKMLEVGTGNSSITQLALYQKCGFRVIGIDRDFFKIHYNEKIMENGIECVDMIRLAINL